MAGRKKKKDSGIGGFFMAGATAAASAGAYYLYGPDGTKHRKKVKGWMLKASGEVLEHAERLKQIDADKFDVILKKMEDKYKKVREIDNKDIAKLKKDLKAQWNRIEREAKAGKAKGKLAVAKSKKTVAKARKSATKAKKTATRKVNRVATKVAKKTAPKKRKSTKKKTSKK